MGSERSFGLVFSTVFLLIGAWNIYQDWPQWHQSLLGLGGLGLAVVFAVLAVFFQDALKIPNLLWFKLGQLLHKIVSPLVLGLLFILTIVPTALIMKVLGHDPLRLRMDPDAESYWIHREPPGPEPKSMSRQF